MTGKEKVKRKARPITWVPMGLLIIFGIVVVVLILSKKEVAPIKAIAQTEKPALEELPSYQILDLTDRLDGKRDADVLIVSFSTTTPREKRESVFKRIAKKEGFAEGSFYCTVDAYHANYSDSYSKAHPRALEEGYLGRLEGMRFIESSYLRE